MMTGTSLMKMKTRSCKIPQCALEQLAPRLQTRLTIGLLQYFERKHDVILFAIDSSQSMLALREDLNHENTKTSRLLTALDAAAQIQKRKVVVGPYDSVGIMLYNTVRVHARTAAFSPVTTWPHRRAGMKPDQAQRSRKEHMSTNLCLSLTQPRFLT
jgi:hypothetical protein